MLLSCCICDIFVKTHTIVTKRFFSSNPRKEIKGEKITSRRHGACFVVMYLLNSKFPPGFISVDAKNFGGATHTGA